MVITGEKYVEMWTDGARSKTGKTTGLTAHGGASLSAQTQKQPLNYPPSASAPLKYLNVFGEFG